MRVVIVGAGFSGLFIASELVNAGCDEVLVVDRMLQAGGIARTIARDGYALEPAASTFMLPHPDLSPILERAEINLFRPDISPSRYVYAHDRLVEIQASPRALSAPLLRTRAKLRALAEPLVRTAGTDDETLLAFCRRRFGDEAGSMLAWLMATGVYAGDPGELAAHAAFPRLTSLEQRAGSVLAGAMAARRARPASTTAPRPHVPVQGMSAVFNALSASLGDRYVPGFTVTTVRPSGRGWRVEGSENLFADAVVMTTHPHHTAAVVDPELSRHLQRARSAPVVTVGLGGLGQAPFPSGFGALITPGSLMVTRGLLFESDYAPGRAPEDAWLLKIIVGGSPFPEVASWEDDRLLDVVTAEAERVFDANIYAQFGEVVRHEPGIPQYVTGHANWLVELERLLEVRPGLHLSGWGYRGVGVGDLATEAVRVATNIRRWSGEQFS